MTTKLIKNLVSQLLKPTDPIRIIEQSNEKTSIKILVKKENIGIVIGAGGKNLRALKTISTIATKKPVEIRVEEIEYK